MALTYVSSLVKAKGYGKPWQNIDITGKTFVELFNTYAQIYIRLKDSYTAATKDLHISEHRNVIPNINATVNQWMVAVQNVTLPYETSLLTTRLYQVLFCNGNLANYNAQHVSHIYSPDTDVPASERRDLLITKSGIDKEKLFKNCLFCVNGMFHRSELTGNGVVVKEGGASQRQGNHYHFGILDFERVGEIEQFAITEENLIKEEGVPLRQSAYIKSPIPLEGKSVIVVIGGYIFAGERNVFTYTGNDLLHVDMSRIELMPRLYESSKRIEMEFLKDYYVEEGNPFEYLKVEDVLSDDFAKAYLTLPQSFVVAVNTEDLVAERQKLENDKIIGTFLTETNANSLIQTGYGRCEDYWWQKDGRRFVLYVNSNLTENFAFKNHAWKEEEYVGRMLDAEKPYYQADAWFLHLNSTELIPTPI